MGLLPNAHQTRTIRVDDTLNKLNSTTNYSPFQIIIFSATLLLAYIWTLPLRDIYGIDLRNALMAREMLENGMAFIPRSTGQLYPDYPPLYFWLEVFFSIPFGHVNILTAILPSALSAIGLVVLTLYLGREINRTVGWLAALILATSPSFWLEAGSATIDMLLAFNVMAAIFCFYFGDQNEDSSKRRLYILGGCIFCVLAFLTKGPIGIVIPAATWGAYLLLQKRIRHFFGFAVLTAVIGIVCGLAELIMAWKNGGMEFLHEVIKMQLTDRVAERPNKAVFYYLVCILTAFGPWFLWCLPVVGRFLRRFRKDISVSDFRGTMPPHPVSKLVLVWFLIVFIIFTLASTKHSRYILPLFPALAIMLAKQVSFFLDKAEISHVRLWNSLLSTLPILLVIAAMVFLVFFYPNPVSSKMVVFAATWFGVVCAAWMAIRKIARKQHLTVALLLMVLATGLSGFNLFAQPLISKRASGSSFVRRSEEQVDRHYPVAIYGLGRDADGVKYAFYSNRKSDQLVFLSNSNEIRKLPSPCILVAYQRDFPKVQKVLGTSKYRLLTSGFIRSKAVVAYLIEALI